MPTPDAPADSPAASPGETQRAIARRLASVEERIEAACTRAGRERSEITLVAVSKTFPLDVIRAARAAGLHLFGENRARELRDKAGDLPGTFLGGDGRAPAVAWHMIGHLQRNKAKYVARHADYLQSLDSPRLADELDKRAAKNDRVLPCLAQVNVSGADQKYGFASEDVHAFLDDVAGHAHLRVEGIMAMASHTDDEAVLREQFGAARRLFETYDAAGNPQVDMKHLSIGMSNDFEVAIEEGATMLRLGSALFGARDYD